MPYFFTLFLLLFAAIAHAMTVEENFSQPPITAAAHGHLFHTAHAEAVHAEARTTFDAKYNIDTQGLAPEIYNGLANLVHTFKRTCENEAVTSNPKAFTMALDSFVETLEECQEIPENRLILRQALHLVETHLIFPNAPQLLSPVVRQLFIFLIDERFDAATKSRRLARLADLQTNAQSLLTHLKHILYLPPQIDG